MPSVVHPSGWPAPPGYSHAVVARGPLLFVSGQVPLDAAGELVGAGDFDAQVVQVFENLGVVLRTGGASWATVVKLQYFVVDLDPGRLQAIRRIRDRYLPPEPRPASSLVGVAALFRPDVWVEIEAVAELGGGG